MPDLMKPELQEVKALRTGAFETGFQVNKVNEADVEILLQPDQKYLVQSVDTLCEEWTSGLYQDPYTAGWVSAAAALSDIAASGVLPTCVLQSVVYPEDMERDDRLRLQKGFHDICNIYKLPLLGGDTNSGPHLSMSSVITGYSEVKPLMRSGVQPGDFLIALDKIGNGPALALSRIFGIGEGSILEEDFRPLPKVLEMAAHRELFRASIDTSDSVIGAIYDLCDVNQLGFEMLWDDQMVDDIPRRFMTAVNLPYFLLFLCEHGDYTQLVSVEPQNIRTLKQRGLKFEIIGRFNDQKPGVSYCGGPGTPQINVPREWGALSQYESLSSLAQRFSGFCSDLVKLGFC